MKQIFQINDTFCCKDLPDGNLSEISQRVILYTFFEKTQLKSRFRDFFAFEIDKSLVDPYDSTWLKLITILVYVVEVIASMVMVAFVAFETQGLAGHYRTLINQLLSYLYGGVRILSYIRILW